MADFRSSFKRGFMWMGSASLVAGLVDLISLVVLLRFLTREQMGLATLAWTAAVIIEALNGLGVGYGLVQASTVTRRQIDSLFWFVMGCAGLLTLAVAAVSPLIASFYGAPELWPMIIVAASKLLFVGAALVPLQLLNRELRYREIAVARTLGTFASAAVKIVLAVAGLGTWAPVIGHTVSGVAFCAAVFAARPLAPRLVFAYQEIRPFIQFGLKASASAIIYQFSRNMDYLIVGRVFGKEILGLYRVAFDIAMAPAEVLLQVVTRTVFPLFCQVKDRVKELAESFVWTQRSLALLLVPLAVFLSFGASGVMSILGKSEWSQAAPAIPILAWAAVVRILARVYPQFFLALGSPQLAVFDSLLTLAVLAAMFAASIAWASETTGVLAVCYAWLFAYALIILVLGLVTRRLIVIPWRMHLSSFKDPALMAAVAAVPACLLSLIREPLSLSPAVSSILIAILILASILVFIRRRGVSIKDFIEGNISGGTGPDGISQDEEERM
jgi:O-antigen/teichoic acid export membrane protein